MIFRPVASSPSKCLGTYMIFFLRLGRRARVERSGITMSNAGRNREEFSWVRIFV
jgi:hypothetical protein